MEIEATKLKSLVEAIAILNKIGSPIPGVPGPASKEEIWGAALNPLSPVSVRETRDFITQVVQEILSDSDSTGAGLSQPGTYGGGNRTVGLGHVLLRATTGKHVYLRAGNYGLRVTPTSIEITVDDGANWVSIFTLSSGTIEWSPTSIYTDTSWVSYQGKLYLSLYSPNLGKIPGTNYPPPGFPLNPPVPWWLLFTERSGSYFLLPNTILGTVPDGSITDIKVAAGAAINASKIGGGNVSNTEFNYLDGVTSPLQPQLNSKASENFSRRTVSSSSSILTTDKLILVNASSGPITVTLPTVASCGDGKVFWIKKIDTTSNKITIEGAGSETIDGNLIIETTSPYVSFTVGCDVSQWFIL